MTGPMVVARTATTATLLKDGRVLIAGGLGAGGTSLASAELYDPATGKFGGTGSMTTARVAPTATRLTDGRVLIVGGQNPAGGGHMLASAELYDPDTGAFTATGSMTTARSSHTTTLLQDGSVLVAGGITPFQTSDSSAAGEVVGSAELYDPPSGTFRSPGPLIGPRADATATLLQDGRVLIAGGTNDMSMFGNAVSSAELYDPISEAFTATGSMTTTRLGATATLLLDGRVLLAGGNSGAADVISPQASAELFDPVDGTFTPAGVMSWPRIRHTATLLLDGRVLIVGGGEGPAPLVGAELFDPAAGTFTPTAPKDLVGGDCTATRLLDGRVLVAGCWNGDASAPPNLYVPAGSPRSPSTALGLTR
jgi:hypothetical protein